MSSDIHIFAEGIADVKFLSHYLHHLDVSAGLAFRTITIDKIGGKSNVSTLGPDFERNQKMGVKNILVIDADQSYDSTMSELIKLSILKDNDVAIFLFPNNKDQGDLETLLEQIINQKNAAIFDCWNDYEACLNGKTGALTATGKYTTPARKTKIYAYLEALLGTSKKQKEKIKEPNRDYLNKDHWDLNAEYLNPLKEFIQKI